MASSGSAWKNPMGNGPGNKKDPGDLVDFQGSPPPVSRTVHPNGQENKKRCQEACMDEQGEFCLLTKKILSPDKIQLENKVCKRCKVGTTSADESEGVYGHFWSVQGVVKKSQKPSGIESHGGHEG